MTTADQTRLVESLTDEIWRRLNAAGAVGAPAPDYACSSKSTCSPCDITELMDHGACRVSLVPPTPSVDPATAAMIDHTLLKPDATREEIVKICDEAFQDCFSRSAAKAT